MDTLILRDPRFLDHDPGGDSPENAGRLAPTLDWLERAPPTGTRQSRITQP